MHIVTKIFIAFSINRATGSVDQKIVLIDPTSIEHRSSQVDSNLKFYRIFNQSSNSFDWLKIWKTQIFEKQSNLIQKLLKIQCFINEMHEYEIKSFSKTLEFNPNLPKTRFSINLSLKLKH